MKTNKFILSFFALIFLSSRLVYANDVSCPAVPVSIVNQSNQAVTLAGANTSISVPAKSSLAVSLRSSYFYNRCGLIQLSVGADNIKAGLIDSNASSVAISITPDNKVDSIGLSPAGFNLYNYISWYGYHQVLS